jgi:hypothetical protein
LHRASWAAEKVFKARGWLRPLVWCAETKDGRRQVFETACEVKRGEISDDQALAALCAELREDFISAGVVRYGVAFPARAATTLRASILHRDAERHDVREVVVVEAHDATTHCGGTGRARARRYPGAWQLDLGAVAAKVLPYSRPAIAELIAIYEYTP